MEFILRPILFEDREAIMDVFNYYAENSFAAYPETKLPYQAFDLFLQMSKVRHGLDAEDALRRIEL
jgi:hypothetical protein